MPVSSAIEHIGYQRGQLDWHIALDTVAGLDEVLDSSVGAATTELGLIGIIDDRLLAHPSSQHKAAVVVLQRIPKRRMSS